MNKFPTPALRLEYFVNKKYRIKSDFARELGMKSWSSMAKYIGSGEKSILGAQYLVQLEKIGLDIYWYLTGQQIDNSNLYKGEDIIDTESSQQE